MFFVVLLLAATPQQFVLLKPGTVLRPPQGISASADTEHPACCDDATRTVVARFIADAGDLLEIETLGTEPDPLLHCGVTGEDNWDFAQALASYRLRVFVDRAAVVPVLERTLRRSFSDGTSVVIGAGLPVDASEEGLLHFGRFQTTQRLTVPAKSSEVGTTYTPARIRPGAAALRELMPGWRQEKTPSKSWFIASGDSLATVGHDGSALLTTGLSWPAARVTRIDGGVLVPLDDGACVKLVAKASRADVFEAPEPVPPRYPRVSISLCVGWSDTCVRPGSTVFWPDGRVAGTTAGDGLTRAFDAGLPGHQCFHVTLQGVNGSLPLCLRDSDIRSAVSGVCPSNGPTPDLREAAR